jgi:hypothetical protein
MRPRDESAVVCNFRGQNSKAQKRRQLVISQAGRWFNNFTISSKLQTWFEVTAAIAGVTRKHQ